MNSLKCRQIMWAAIAASALLCVNAGTLLAADAGSFTGGDLTVDGIHFSVDGSVIRKLTDLANPWTTSNLDLYYLTGNVGIGTLPTTNKLSVAGIVESTTGGFKFPDGTTMTTAPLILSSSTVAIGSGAYNATATGTDNTAIGVNALDHNTTGYRNTAYGSNALYVNTNGAYNIANGFSALYSNTSGSYNTANGTYALSYNTTGGYNTANGTFALYSNTTGDFNTAYGYGALSNNKSGGFNIGIGYNAGVNLGTNLSTGSYNIDIGNFGVAGDSNTIRIGDSNQTRAFIAGIRGTATGANDAQPVVIDSAGQLGSALTLKVPGNNNWDLNNTEGDFTIGNATIRLKIGVPIDGGGAGDIAIKADGGQSHLSLIAAGGTTIFSNTARTSGVALGAGSGSWSSVSDRAAKKDLEPIDSGAILDKVAAMPLYTWRYISEVSGARHIGPMAQDFYAAFHMGDSDKTITTVDADGVALAAIQALKAENDRLKQEADRQNAENLMLKARLERLEKLMGI